MVCTKQDCRFNNRAGATYCASCGESLAAAPSLLGEATMRGFEAAGSKSYVKKNCFLATILAVFPGIGQLYNGDYKKMAAIWVTSALGFFLSWTVVVPLIALGIYGWSIVDAYSVAKGRTPLW